MILVCSCVCLGFRQLTFSAKTVTTAMFSHLWSTEFEFDDLEILEVCENQKCLTFLRRQNDFLHGTCSEARLTKTC